MALELLNYLRGLSGLVGLKSAGVGPALLSDSVVPTVDVRELFAINDVQNIVASVTAPAQGVNALVVSSAAVDGFGPLATASLIVPAGECWYIHGFTVQGTVGAGAALRASAGLRPGGSAGGLIVAAPAASYVATDQFALEDAFRGSIVPSGWGFAVHIAALTLAPTINANLFFSRLKG